MTEPVEGWSMPVRDAAGRERELAIKIIEGALWLAVPAGGVAVLRGEEIQQLIAMATAARSRLFEQGAP